MATREQIQEYLDIRDIIDRRVNDVLSKNISIYTIPEGEERSMIKLTVETVENKQKYLREKPLFKEAIIKHKENFDSDLGGVDRIAIEYKLHLKNFNEQIKIHTETGPDYEYDKNVEGEFFSYIQEGKLWECVKSLVEKERMLCSCRVCVLMETAKLACDYIKSWNLDYCYPQFYLNKAASMEWIKKFEMRHREEIDNLFEKSCSLPGEAVEPVEPVEPVSKKRCM